MPFAVAGAAAGSLIGGAGGAGVITGTTIGVSGMGALVGGMAGLGIESFRQAGRAAEYSAKVAEVQGKTDAAIANYNAQIVQNQATQKAARLKNAGQIAVDQKLDERRRYLGRVKAAYGASGVQSEGTPLLVEIDTAKNLTLDILTTRYNVENEISGITSEAGDLANIYRLQGESARRAGKLRAGEALFSGKSQQLGIASQMVGQFGTMALMRSA